MIEHRTPRVWERPRPPVQEYVSVSTRDKRHTMIVIGAVVVGLFIYWVASSVRC